MGAHRPQYTNQNWQVEIDAYSQFVKGFDNYPVTTAVIDPTGLFPTEPMTRIGVPVNDDAGYVELANLQSFDSWEIFDRCTTKMSFIDGYGGKNGVEVTANSSDSNGIGCKLFTMPPRKLAWIQFNLEPAEANTIQSVTVVVSSYNGGGAVLRRLVNINTGHSKVVIPFTTPSDSHLSWQLKIIPNQYVPGGMTSFRVSNGWVNVGREPTKIGYAGTRGTGLWDGAHIVLGDYHLWIDKMGRLRLKSSLPTHDEDGVAVGNQS